MMPHAATLEIMHAKRRAFTLVELMVVLTILGIVAAASVPGLPRLYPDDPREGANSVAAVLRWARQTAMDQGRAVSITVDPAHARYRVEAADATRPNDAAEGVIALPAGAALALAGSRAHFVFQPTGRATGEPLTLAEGGRATVVMVDPWTGVVRVTP
jgi:type II secretion system protein H